MEKKNKTSHVQEKIISKQDSTTILKNEQNIIPNIISSNDTDSKTRLQTNNTATVYPITITQPKKRKNQQLMLNHYNNQHQLIIYHQ